MGHSMLSVAFGKYINLGDTFWISEIRFQYTGPISRENKAIDYIFGICHYMCLCQHVTSFEIFLT